MANPPLYKLKGWYVSRTQSSMRDFAIDKGGRFKEQHWELDFLNLLSWQALLFCFVSLWQDGAKIEEQGRRTEEQEES